MGKKKFFAWLWVALCAISIFLIVPVARTIQTFVSARWGRALFGYSVVMAVAVSFFIVLYFLIFRLKIRSAANYLWLIVIAVIYVYFTLKRWRAPEEAIHFLEYGLLGYFLFRALSLSTRDKSIYLTAILIGSLAGIFDESIQWAVPRRYWDFRDVWLNALSGILFQVALWKGIRPKIISQKVCPRSVRKVSWLLAANILLLGLCLSNTPPRVARYTKALPFLAFLQREEVMHDFRYNRYDDPQIGAFTSRLTPEEMARIDNEQSGEFARILDEWQGKSYEQFLQIYNATYSPFLYELRVHLFRRDKKWQEAEGAKNEKTQEEALFIAYKENLIVEKYFGRTVQKSSYLWDEEKKARLESQVDKNAFYRSPVSPGFLGRVSEKAYWTVIAVFLVLLLALNILYSRRHQKAFGSALEKDR
jgi:VanZ family protein